MSDPSSWKGISLPQQVEITMVDTANSREINVEKVPSTFAEFLGASTVDILGEMETQNKNSKQDRASINSQARKVEDDSSRDDDDDVDGENYTNPGNKHSGNPKDIGSGSNPAKRDVAVSPRGVNEDEGSSSNNKKGMFRQQRATLQRLHHIVTSVNEPLILTTTEGSTGRRLSALPYNSLCLEIRDLFRLMEGLVWRAEEQSLTSNDIAIFYHWFEGFFSIVTSIFEVMEDVVFSWLEKIGAISMDRSLAPKRRSTKATRTKDICWDILELKLQLQKSAGKHVGGRTSKSTLEDVVFELATEIEHLAMRILGYAATVNDRLPPLLRATFESTECEMMETALFRNLKASNPGKFVLAAFTRGIETADARSAFLFEVFVVDSQKKKKNAGLKEYKKFFKMHVNMADELAITLSNITHDGTGRDREDLRPGAGDDLQ